MNGKLCYNKTQPSIIYLPSVVTHTSVVIRSFNFFLCNSKLTWCYISLEGNVTPAVNDVN